MIYENWMVANPDHSDPRDPWYDDSDDIVSTCEICGCAIWEYERRIHMRNGTRFHMDCIRDLEDEKLAEMIGGDLEGDD